MYRNGMNTSNVGLKTLNLSCCIQYVHVCTVTHHVHAGTNLVKLMTLLWTPWYVACNRPLAMPYKDPLPPSGSRLLLLLDNHNQTKGSHGGTWAWLLEYTYRNAHVGCQPNWQNWLGRTFRMSWDFLTKLIRGLSLARVGHLQSWIIYYRSMLLIVPWLALGVWNGSQSCARLYWVPESRCYMTPCAQCAGWYILQCCNNCWWIGCCHSIIEYWKLCLGLNSGRSTRFLKLQPY